MHTTPLTRYIALLCTLAPAFYFPTLQAQEFPSQPEATEILITYSANRFDQSQTSVLASTSTISRQQIEKLAADTALDVIKILPSVEVATQGTKGNTSSLFIRGTNSNQTLVLVDGVRINSPASGIAEFGLIPAFVIEKIEVIRGPRAAVYGADAMGGIISITTVPVYRANTHQFTLAGGSNRYNQQAWRSSGQISDSTYGNIVINNESDQGYYLNSVAPRGSKFGYSTQSLFANLHHDINDAFSASFNGYQLDSKAEFAGANPTTWSYSKDETTSNFYSLAGSLNFHNDWLKSALQYNLTNNKIGTRDIAKTRPESIIEARRHTLSWLNTLLPYEYLTINVGVDYNQDLANQSGANRNFEQTKINNSALFVTSLFDFDATTIELSTRYDDNSAYGQHLTWSAGVGYQVTDTIELALGAGNAFRAPSFNDLYWPNDSYTQGNPTLKAETSLSTEISLSGYHTTAIWQLTAYAMQIDNLIEWAPNTAWIYMPTNINQAKIRGVEFNIDFNTGHLNHVLSADWKDPINTATNKVLVNRAKQNYSWRISHSFGKLNNSLLVQYVGERPDSTNNMMKAYTILNLSSRYQITENLQATIKVNNITNMSYQTAHYIGDDYYLGQGRSGYAGIKYQF